MVTIPASASWWNNSTPDGPTNGALIFASCTPHASPTSTMGRWLGLGLMFTIVSLLSFEVVSEVPTLGPLDQGTIPRPASIEVSNRVGPFLLSRHLEQHPAAMWADWQATEATSLGYRPVPSAVGTVHEAVILYHGVSPSSSP